MYDAFTETVLTIIDEHAKASRDEITLDSRLRDLGIDSMDALALIFDFEEEFDVAIPNEEALRIETVRQAIEALRTLVPERAPDTEVAT